MSLARQLLNPLFNSDYQRRVRGMHPAHLAAYWPLAESSGLLAREQIGRTAAVDLIQNGRFETAGSPVFDVWTQTVGDGAITDETTVTYSGSHACKITAGASANSWAVQEIHVQPGAAATLTLYSRGDGSSSGRYALYDSSNAAWVQSMTSLALAGTTYTKKEIAVTIPSGCVSLRLYLACPPASGGTAYFDQVSLTGSFRLDGTYAPSGISLAQPGIGCGRAAPSFSGANSYVWIGTPQFNTLFDPAKGSAIAWGRVDSAARWTDTSTFRYLFHPKAANDATYYLVFGKHTTAHTLFWRRRAGAATYEQTHTFSPSGPSGWFCLGFTWDIANTHFKGFLSQLSDSSGSRSWSKLFDDSAAAAGCDPWNLSSNPVDGEDTMLMAGSPTAQEWIGGGAHVAIWRDRVLSDAEMRHVMTLP